MRGRGPLNPGDRESTPKPAAARPSPLHDPHPRARTRLLEYSASPNRTPPKHSHHAGRRGPGRETPDPRRDSAPIKAAGARPSPKHQRGSVPPRPAATSPPTPTRRDRSDEEGQRRPGLSDPRNAEVRPRGPASAGRPRAQPLYRSPAMQPRRRRGRCRRNRVADAQESPWQHSGGGRSASPSPRARLLPRLPV